jgi:hypothetical protein
MSCRGFNSRGLPCGNASVDGNYCAWHKIPQKKERIVKQPERIKPKTIKQRATEIQKIVCIDKGQNQSKHTIVNEVTVAVYTLLFPVK